MTHLEDVVVDEAHRLGELLSEREDLNEILVGDLVHPVRVDCGGPVSSGDTHLGRAGACG